MNGAWRPAPGEHVAQLYQRDSFLHASISAFFTGALSQGEHGVIIARPQTFEAVTGRLGAATNGCAAETVDRLMFIDVSAALEQFMNGTSIEPARVEQGFSSLLSGLRGRGAAGTIWIYGEMVDVLCRQGDYEAAIRLEQIWNRQFASPDVSVLCGYSLEAFDEDADARMLHRVCREHTHVVPSEGFAPPVSAGVVPATVFIVDDDPSVRRSLQRLLALNGWHVRTYPSAEAFLADAAASSTGCLVLDVGLGGMSGLDLQRWMARARWSMPVVAISGGHDPHVEVQALRLGATAFLPKPFGSRALIDAITRAMSERHH